MNYLLIILIAIGAINATALAEPVSDYSFSCLTYDKKLHILGGVDPSGGFALSIQGQGPFRFLDGLNYVAKRMPESDSKTVFLSATYVKPKLILTIDWLNKHKENVYAGRLNSNNINGGRPLAMRCSIVEI